MPGIKCKTVDLGACARKLTDALLASDQRKREAIRELRRKYDKKGYPPWKAVELAEAEYSRKPG